MFPSFLQPKPQFLGVADDPRTQLQKDQDFDTREFVSLASASPIAPKVNWVKTPPNQWRNFLIRSQNGSGSCVAQTSAKLLEIENNLEEPEKKLIQFSARDIYIRRANQGSAGMYGPDALSICSKFGAASEAQVPSQDMTENEINAPLVRTAEMMKFADYYKAGGYGTLPASNVEALASFIQQTGKGIMLFAFFTNDEWTDVPVIKHKSLGPNDLYTLRHSITGTEPIIWINDEKALVIEDSWGKFNQWKGQRVLTESFIKERVYFAGNLLNLKNPSPAPLPIPSNKPKLKFTTGLSYGIISKEVRMLQDMLKYEGFFPKTQMSTGGFYAITAKALKAWQINHKIMDFANENNVRNIKFGPKSLILANKLYA